jgi:uncharacterized protein YlaI
MKKKVICSICDKKFSISEKEVENLNLNKSFLVYCNKCMETFDTDRDGNTIETHKFEIVEYKSEDFDRCDEIYQKHFFNDVLGEKDKGLFDLTMEGNKLFVMKIKEEIIGFGGYELIKGEKAYMLRSEFLRKYEYGGGYKKRFDDYILDLIKSHKTVKSISLYTSEEEDVNYYKAMGFVLYKDFKIEDPEMYEDIWGEDVMRFAFDMHL